MGFSREEILAGSEPHPDFEKILSQSKPPALPAGIDVLTLRKVTNAAKAQARKAHGGPPAGVTEREVNIPLRDNTTIPVIIYAPSDPTGSSGSLPLFIFFHGGGFCIGSRNDDSESNRELGLQNRVVVVSPKYRLAPEHPFPVAVHDGLDVLQ